MDWDPDFLMRSPVFEPLRASVAVPFGPRWPQRDELQRLLDLRVPRVVNAQGAPLRLVAPSRDEGGLEDRYEARVYLRGELAVRERSWHDLFNVLAWMAFPCAKAAVNARHHAELVTQRDRAGNPVVAPAAERTRHARTAIRWGNRGPAQDALTLFDEGGMIVASCDAELTGLMRAFEWKPLFHERRARVRSCMRFLVFGHAIYEKALAPFPGITARAVTLDVPADRLNAPCGELLGELDFLAAALIREPARLSATRDLAPVPVLGVPGWCAENERAGYYDDVRYFRRKTW